MSPPFFDHDITLYNCLIQHLFKECLIQHLFKESKIVNGKSNFVIETVFKELYSFFKLKKKQKNLDQKLRPENTNMQQLRSM